METRNKKSQTIAAAAWMLLAAAALSGIAPTTAAGQTSTMPMGHDTTGVHGRADANFTLRSGIANGKMVFIGRGGEIDGKVNPDLDVHEGDLVEVTLVNGEGAEHDVVFPDFHTSSPHVTGRGASATISFRVGSAGSFSYYCDLPGHREAGMEGRIRVEILPATAAKPEGVSIVRDPSDLPGPVGDRAPINVRFDLEAVERVARLDQKATYNFWTFNGKVPGPFLRVRVGDTVDVHLKNMPDDVLSHSIDLHAVNGPGGGAVLTDVAPGEEKSFIFKALTPGLFVYHCATPMVANHISNGMYGLILVDFFFFIDKVYNEFYIMQGELYTNAPFGYPGLQEMNIDKLVEERPDYFTFNGAVGALTAEHPLLS